MSSSEPKLTRTGWIARPRDYWPTPRAAVVPLLPFLAPQTAYVEPCAGAGDLSGHLAAYGHTAVAQYDIEPQADHIIQADAATLTTAQMGGLPIITNPPWTRGMLYPLLHNWLDVIAVPYVWVLLDGPWLFTIGASEWMSRCSDVVPVGRVVWVPGTTSGTKDSAWYRLQPTPTTTTLHPRRRPPYPQ